MRSNRAIILTVPDLERLRRFALAIGLVTLTYGVAGISLTAGSTVSPFGIPFTISRPDFLPVGLAIASLYAAARFYYYGFMIRKSPFARRKDLLSLRHPVDRAADDWSLGHGPGMSAGLGWLARQS